ncbi:MAG: MBL fold metallo-hydrolase [Candidatus Pacebacteria bacterium]|nr:MBL fold metallo-hydrolase [Candidatus Paceibacterota bacterium]
MEIISLGHSAFRIKTKTTTLVTDPYDSSIGLKMPKVAADIVTVSHQHHDHNQVDAVSGTSQHPRPFIIAGPGEYEINQVFILGLPTFHDSQKGEKRGKNTIYLIMADGLKLCHLGDLGHKLSDKQVEQVNQVDVLFIPVGGTYTLTLEKIGEVINHIDPKIVVPMHYQQPGLNLDLLPVDKFLAELGIEKQPPVDKLIVKPESLPEERKIVVLKQKA